jgi:hypothetical protein
VTELLKTSDATTRDADGWLVHYDVRRDDGETVLVEAHCTGTAEAVARAHGDAEALAYIADRGRSAALDFAERAQSPKHRGATLVRLAVDSLSGGLMRDYEYALPVTVEFE